MTKQLSSYAGGALRCLARGALEVIWSTLVKAWRGRRRAKRLRCTSSWRRSGAKRRERELHMASHGLPGLDAAEHGSLRSRASGAAFSTSPRRAYGKRPANAAGHVCELHGREPREATEGQCHEITPSSEPGALGMLVPLSIQKMEREMNMTRQVAQVPSTRAAAGSRCTTMLCAGSRPIKMA